ncbi:MAG TPA: bis(5'-nucleosyl)-tetraphosphatase (symmetrical) YqeK [Spirochaetota bacterium]|nr:bis(5'-nucleosyl)-tetraphosphatase (symmetrical) YqeK [Spirochaetota bacterium]HPP05235.1 bis(5'-nucleosyl)-tetraphosphatase (symmetrical) YqeK [Spirochaetota bacterium]
MFDNIILKKYLTNEKRISHSISTAMFMKKYAIFFDIDPEKAYFAGLYHDIAKEMPIEDVIKLAKNFKNRDIFEIKYFDFKVNNPVLLHGVAAAEILIKEYNITDREILISICQHTTGGVNLPRLAQWTYLADYCEPLRKYSDSMKIRKIITKEKNFYKAYYYSYNYILSHLLDKNKLICAEAIDGYNEALQLYENSII